jgi:DNA-binding beta-propeller fold protein YncE
MSWGSFDISDSTYDSKNKDTSSEITGDEQGVFFKPDGTKMYILNNNGSNVFQYSLSTAWDVSTASYDSKTKSFFYTDTDTKGMFFKPDGTKIYIAGNSQSKVFQHSLSTAWDISTASSSSEKSFSTSDSNSTGIFFKPDGTKMYVCGYATDKVYQYDLSTAWDVSSASLIGNISISSKTDQVQDVFFNDSGTKMYVMDDVKKYIYQYSLSTAWSITTATYDNDSYYFNTTAGAARGFYFRIDNGTKLYIFSSELHKVFQYTTYTPTTFIPRTIMF